MLRRLDDELDPRSYRNLFAVLDEAAGSAGRADFFDRMRETIAGRLGWRDTVLVAIPDAQAPFPAEADALSHFHSNRPTSFLEEYVDRWYGRNPFKTAEARRLHQLGRTATLADVRHYANDDEWGFVDKYLRPHRISDVFSCSFAGDGAGAMLLCRFLDSDTTPSLHDRLIAGRLNTHLAPWISRHFERIGPSITTLSRREQQVALLVAEGLSNSQIAARLRVTTDTVKKHIQHAMAKAGCGNRTQLAVQMLARVNEGMLHA